MIIDSHVHNSDQTDYEYLKEFLVRTKTDKACLLSVAHSKKTSMINEALALKAKYPDMFFVFTEPLVSAYYEHEENLGAFFAKYCQSMIDRGCDGIKMLEGKPQMRKMYPIPDFDLPVWEDFFAWAEEKQVPITWHVNDPENFWDADNAPAFAISQGWLYDSSYVNNEDQYRQVLTVLKRHSKLRICFAHFFFMSAQLERLSDILDSYPNTFVDITPGIEMYENFSKDIEKTKSFFEKYHDRIIYGTDIGGRCVLMGEDKVFDEEENLRRPVIVRSFLSGTEDIVVESDGHYLIGREPFTMHCLGLSGQRLEEILSLNFLRFLGRIN